MFAKCVDDPQVLELLQKCFVRIKTAKQITAISHENRATSAEEYEAKNLPQYFLYELQPVHQSSMIPMYYM